MAYCTNCGAPNLPEARFCATCGAALFSAAASPSDSAPSAPPSSPPQQPPHSPMAEQKTSMGLRILEIIAGIIVLALGAYVIAYPEVPAAVLIAFLAIGLLIISGMGFVRAFQEGISRWQLIAGIIVLALGAYVIAYLEVTAGLAFLAVGLLIISGKEFVRAFQEGISGRRRLLKLILWIIALLLAIAVLFYPLTYGSLFFVYLLGLGLIFAGFASIARGTPATMVIGIIGIILAILTFVAIILYPPQGVGLGLGVVLALVFVALALIIFGLEAIASGVVGRWV